MSRPISDHEIATAMVVYGGGFVSALGNAWCRGDAINQAKLKAAFPALFEEYRELIELRSGKAGQ